MVREKSWDGMRTERRRFLKDALIGGGMAWAAPGLTKNYAQVSTRAAVQESDLKATIAIDASDVRHTINPNIYGTFIEHIGRCIYGGVYQEGSPQSDAVGFRKDVMKAASEWGVPILRWPGGDFSSGYHWQDGIGPKELRPRRYNAAWFEEESNHFGTDEFIAYCRKIGAAPYICVNMGTGTIQEAANWVEYCNGSGDTYYANLRRKNGHPEPYQVIYWGLGNEVYGSWQIGHKDATDYSKMALECAKMMKWVDPTIRLVACGSQDPKWNLTVLEALVNVVDYISLHDYEGAEGYYEELETIEHLESGLKLTAAAIELTDPQRGKDPVLALSIPEIRTKKRIEIACDEWNIWYRKRNIWNREIPNPVEEKYNLRDALWVASVLNLFQRRGDWVTMANIAQMVNAIGTMFTNDEGMFLQTIYFPMKLYRQECGSRALGCKVESPAVPLKDSRNLPFLDVSATLGGDARHLSIAVVNRHQTEPIHSTISIGNVEVTGDVAVFEINGASPDVENSFAEPGNVKIVHKNFGPVAEKFEYPFPAHSVTLLKVSLA